ncbi:MAG: LytTR family DNA-binding domain-containing protein [Lachnospiraceae bacterium]|nr:LytTR family DNA-binding domain-containing protein [Lachnospiraceae bacterium]
MLRIAICDDETDARDALRIQLEKLLIEDSEEIVYEFSSGTNAASWLHNHPGEIDLLFLDVEMKGLNGMETAEKIRSFDEQLLIVFVTGYSDYVFDGYRVGALNYLMKPVAEKNLRQLLGHVRKKTAQEKTYTVKNIDGTWRFRLSDILYFYSDRRKVTLVTAKGHYPFYARLDEIEKQLSPDFVRIHQRYLINPASVDYLGSESVTIHGEALSCSRKYRETALRKIARSMIGGRLT